MKLKILTEDPLQVLSSAKFVVENARDVFLNEKGLKVLAEEVAKRLSLGLEDAKSAFGTTGDYERDVQLIFIEDAVNFCFWSERDKPRWEVEWPPGRIIRSGWYCLKACFERALAENLPILDAGYLESITLDQAGYLFRGVGGVKIPLLAERAANLREAGRVLKKKYGGHFSNLLVAAKNDVVLAVTLICQDFLSFRDTSLFERKEVYFFKRAQICLNDISYLPEAKINRLSELTAFADYRLPQVLREFGAINYSKDLAEWIDNLVLIPAGSREEIEIRAATIWAIELIRQKLKKYTAGQIDNTIWLVSQENPGRKPHHRTYTIFY